MLAEFLHWGLPGQLLSLCEGLGRTGMSDNPWSRFLLFCCSPLPISQSQGTERGSIGSGSHCGRCELGLSHGSQTSISKSTNLVDYQGTIFISQEANELPCISACLYTCLCAHGYNFNPNCDQSYRDCRCLHTNSCNTGHSDRYSLSPKCWRMNLYAALPSNSFIFIAQCGAIAGPTGREMWFDAKLQENVRLTCIAAVSVKISARMPVRLFM